MSKPSQNKALRTLVRRDRRPMSQLPVGSPTDDRFRSSLNCGHRTSGPPLPKGAMALNRCAIARCAGSPTASAATGGKIVRGCAACLRTWWSRIERSAIPAQDAGGCICIVKNLNDGHRAIGEAVIMLTRSLKQFRLDNIEVCCGLQKLVRAMMLQGCRKADRAEVVERDRFATPNSLKSHGERNLLSPYLCQNAKVVHAFEANTLFEKLPGTQINVPRLNLHKRPRHRRCPTSRDFVPWRFSDAGRRSAWIASSCRHPKTCTRTVIETVAAYGPVCSKQR